MSARDKEKILIEAFRKLPDREKSALIEIAEVWVKVLGIQTPKGKSK